MSGPLALPLSGSLSPRRWTLILTPQRARRRHGACGRSLCRSLLLTSMEMDASPPAGMGRLCRVHRMVSLLVTFWDPPPGVGVRLRSPTGGRRQQLVRKRGY